MNTEQLEKQLWIINNETIPRLTKRVNELEAEVTALQEFSVLMTADKIRSESAQTPPAPTPQIFRCPDCSGRVLGSAPCQRCNTAAQTPAPTLKEMKAQEPNMINAIMSDVPTPTVSGGSEHEWIIRIDEPIISDCARCGLVKAEFPQNFPSTDIHVSYSTGKEHGGIKYIECDQYIIKGVIE